MPATTISFFNPQDLLGFAADGYVVQDDPVTNAETYEEAVGLKDDGNFAANDLFNKVKEGSLAYKHFGVTGDLTLPPVGYVSPLGYLLKDFTLEYSVKDFPTLNCSVHKSVTGAAHGAYRNYTPTVTLPCQRGIPRGIADVVELGVDDAGIGMLKLSYALKAEFVTPDTAEFTAGEFCNAYEEITVGFSGVPASVTLGTGWQQVTQGGGRGNKTAEGYEITIRKRYTAHDAAA